MVMLSAFVRQKAPSENNIEHIDSLVQAALTVIARQSDHIGNIQRYIDLQGCNLTKAVLRKAELEGVNLARTNLTKVNLMLSNLRGAFRRDAILQDAVLDCANLQEIDLGRANLCRSSLIGVELAGAYLEDADLSDANLTGAKGLTEEQIRGARGNRRTRLPAGLQAPADWFFET